MTALLPQQCLEELGTNIPLISFSNVPPFRTDGVKSNVGDEA
jgi:hypothetical protein